MRFDDGGRAWAGYGVGGWAVGRVLFWFDGVTEGEEIWKLLSPANHDLDLHFAGNQHAAMELPQKSRQSVSFEFEKAVRVR